MKSKSSNKLKINKKESIKNFKKKELISSRNENLNFNLIRDGFKQKDETSFLCLILLKNNDRPIKIIKKEELLSFLKAKTNFKITLNNKIETFLIQDVIEYSIFQTINFAKLKK